MKNATKTAKVKASTVSLWDNAHVKSVSVWVLLHEGKSVGKVLWTWSNSGTCKCAIVCHKPELFGVAVDYDSEATTWALGSFVIGSAGGYGYDKRSAAFSDCLNRNTVNSDGRSPHTEPRDYLQSLGFQVIEAI